MKWVAITNRAAGRARAAQAWLHGLRGHVACDVLATAGNGDATELARGAVGYDGLIAVGGDGTVAEILQGMDLARQQLAVFPAGHGNCLARDLGVPDGKRAMEALRAGVTRPLDLMSLEVTHADGRRQQRLCASTVAVGYVADVVVLGRGPLAALGRAAYAAAACVVPPRRFAGSLQLDAVTRTGPWTGVVVNNTVHLANFPAFPDARPDDGMLDVMEQDYGWPRQLLQNLATLAHSRAYGALGLHRAARVGLRLDAPATLMVDGELLPDVIAVDVRCLPAAVRCIAGVR